jgi:hypothetical protein
MNLGRRPAPSPRTLPPAAVVTIRIAAERERSELARVAERDSRPLPPAPRLVAERDGTVLAILSLETGEVVADPFRPTAELVELLRCRAASEALDRPGGGGRRRLRTRRTGRRIQIGLAGAGGRA